MEKYRTADIKPFQFSDLQGKTATAKGEFKPFSFGELNGQSINTEKPSEESIRTERSFAKKNDFKVDEVVRTYRGLSRQEQNDLEKNIQDEVTRRLEAAYQEAHAQGLAEGREAGHAEAIEQAQAAYNEKIAELSNIVADVKGQASKLLSTGNAEVIEFIKRFSKWVILKEIDEKVYLEALLEKLVLELNTRKNIIVKVGKTNFRAMPEIIASVEQRVGQLSNVRVEIVSELNHPGIILESENGLIDGSLEGVFSSIDKIFEQLLPAGNNT